MKRKADNAKHISAKHIFVFGLLALLLMSFFPAAHAEEETVDESSDESTLAEASLMDTGVGAQIRLLQLEKSITRNILIGNEVIDYLQKNNTNTTELEAIITELEALKLEVQDLDPSSEDATEKFVSIKQEAIDLSKEFRDVLKELVGEGNRPLLFGKISGIDRSELDVYNEDIKNLIHSQNFEIVSKIFESLGIENDELLQQIKDGSATYADVKKVISETVKDMTPQERKEAWTEIKESGVRKEIAARAKIEKARLNINERKSIRLEYLTKASGQIKDSEVKARVQASLEKRSGIVDARIERISGRLEKIQEARQNIREDIKDRRMQTGRTTVPGTAERGASE